MSDSRIIDVHHHAFPPEAPVRPWSLWQDISFADEQHITDLLLSCPLQTEAATAHRYNSFLAKEVRKAPTRCRMLGVLPYDDMGLALEEVSYVLDDCQAVGFSLNTHNHEIYIGNDCLNPVFDELNRRSAVLVLHPCHQRAPGNQKLVFTANDSVYEYPFDTTRAVMDFVFQDKAARWPNIRLVLPHAGGAIPFLAHRMAASGHWGAIRQSESQIMETLRSFYYDLALSHTDTHYAFMKEFAGTDHLLIGTDYPNSTPKLIRRELQTFRDTTVFTAAEKEKICHTTAKSLFYPNSRHDH